MPARKWFNLLLILLLAAFVLYSVGLAIISSRPQNLMIIAGWASLAVLAFVVASSINRVGKNARISGRVLDQLEQAILLNLPLPRAMAALGEDLHDGKNRHLQSIPHELERGDLVAAVLGRHTSLPKRVLRAISVGEASGQLDRVVPALAEQRRTAMASRIRSGGFYRAYPLFLSVVLLGIVTMLRVFVGPKFQMIFRDFHTPLPWIARTTMTAGGQSAQTFLLVLFMVLTALWWLRLMSITAAAGTLQTPWWHSLVERLPIVGQPNRDAAWAAAFNFIAASLADERPLASSLQAAATLTSSGLVRSKLLSWREQILNGQPIDVAAQTARLPSVLVGLLTTRTQSVDLVETLRFAAGHYGSQARRRRAWLDLVMVPAVALSMGLLVAWVMLSVMVPMVQLIDVMNAKALVVR